MERQTCKICGAIDKFDFNIPEGIWKAVVPLELQNKVVCLTCFDDLARKKGIKYAGSLHKLYFAGSQAYFEFRVFAYADSQSSGNRLYFS